MVGGGGMSCPLSSRVVSLVTRITSLSSPEAESTVHIDVQGERTMLMDAKTALL